MYLFLSIALFLVAIVAEQNVQEALLISSTLAMVVGIGHHCRFPSIVSTVVFSGACLSFVIMYFQYFNAIDIGFNDGLIVGYVGKSTYTDMSYYYQEANILVDTWKSGHWWDWFLGNTEHFGFYGPYNMYNIFNALIISLFGSNLLTLIIIKQFFTASSIFVLYRIASHFLDNRLAVGVLVLYIIYPANLLVSSFLMRDDLIAFLCLLLVFFFLRLERPQGKTTTIIMIMITSVLLILFRFYAAILAIGCLSYAIMKNGFTWKKVVLFAICLLVVVAIIFMSYSVEGMILGVLESGESDGSWSPERSSGTSLLLYSLYYLSFGNTPWIEDVATRVVPEWLNYLGSLYLNGVLFVSFLGFVFLFLRNAADRKLLIVFYLFVPLFLLVIHTFTLGGPIPRTYTMWIWVDLIVLVLFYSRLTLVVRWGLTYGVLIMVMGVYLYKYQVLR